MTITNGYTDLTTMKSPQLLNIPSGTTAQDSYIEAAVEGVSRSIDEMCGRRFFAVSETRYYTAEMTNLIFIDDVASASGITLETDPDGDHVYDYTWASTDYDMNPYNAILDGGVYTMIERAPFGVYLFPRDVPKGVKLTASFGWTTAPKPVVEACKLWTNRLWKRFMSPMGESGANAFGQMTLSMKDFDPDIVRLLKPYMKLNR